jgi:hypothetical protein
VDIAPLKAGTEPFEPRALALDNAHSARPGTDPPGLRIARIAAELANPIRSRDRVFHPRSFTWPPLCRGQAASASISPSAKYFIEDFAVTDGCLQRTRPIVERFGYARVYMLSRPLARRGWLLAWSAAVVAAQAPKRCGLMGKPSVNRPSETFLAHRLATIVIDP